MINGRNVISRKTELSGVQIKQDMYLQSVLYHVNEQEKNMHTPPASRSSVRKQRKENIIVKVNSV